MPRELGPRLKRKLRQRLDLQVYEFARWNNQPGKPKQQFNVHSGMRQTRERSQTRRGLKSENLCGKNWRTGQLRLERRVQRRSRPSEKLGSERFAKASG